MFIKDIIKIIKKYKFLVYKILFYEIFFILRGFKGNRVDFNSSTEFAENVPCPYYFLFKIKNFLRKKNIKSFIDLGSGNGRVIFFFDKYFKIKYYGIEFFEKPYNSAKALFSKNSNIEIKNEDFRNLNFLREDIDCFFLNEPLKNRKDFELVVNAIQKKYINIDKKYFIILINVTENDLKHFSNLQLRDSNIIGKGRDAIHGGGARGYYIFSN